MSDCYGACEDGAKAGYDRGMSDRAGALGRACPESVCLTGTYEGGAGFSYVLPARKTSESPGPGEVRLSGTYADGTPFSYVSPSES